MTPSAFNPPRKSDDDAIDGAKSGEVHANSQSLSNESMPSLLISEGVVSPVEEEEEILDHTPIEDDADSDGIQQQQQQQQNHNIHRIDAEVGMPSMSSSSEWDIGGGRGAFADTASSSSPSTMSYYSQTRQRHREAPSHHENTNDTITPKKSQIINHNGAYRTPPNPPFTPTRSTTPLSYYKKTTDDKSWLDPFPTPDVSLHSRHTTSSEEWNHIVKSIPKLPTTVEFSSPSIELKSKNNTNQQVANTSCPELDILADDNTSSIRRVSSEASLPIIKRNSSLNTLMKRPSMEDFWSALRCGPDGNGIEIEDNRPKYDWDESILRRMSSGDSYRKDSNLYELVDTTSNDNDARRKNVLKWSQSAPLDSNAARLNNEKWEGIRKRHVGNQSAQQKFVSSDNTKSFAPNGKNSSATLTNVTGAGLAKEVKLLRRQRGTMTPGRIRSFLASPTVSRVRTSAEERVFSPVRNALQQSSAATLVRNTHQKLVERKERRRQRRLARMREPPPSWWIVIPADHPYKIAWDVLTMLWSLLGAYRTHIRIRDRVFDQSPLIFLTEIWFLLDIILNFVTEHKTRNGEVIRDGKTVWARYLTTWFVIDALSLIPWERIYVRPIVEKIKRRNFFQKTFFRSRAVVRVSRVLRGRHIKLFGRVSRQTGTPLRQLVTLIIKYVPKYLVFLRNMKGALAVRSLRLVHWLHNIYKKIWVKAKSGIYFRSKSLLAHTLRPDHSPEEDDESDSDGEDDDTGTDNGRNGDDESEIGYRNGVDLLSRVSLQRSYSDSGAPVVRRRCYSSVEFSNM